MKKTATNNKLAPKKLTVADLKNIKGGNEEPIDPDIKAEDSKGNRVEVS